MFILTGDGRVVDDGARPFRELVDGVWGPVVGSLKFGELLDDDARELSAEEVAKLEKSGKSK